MQGRERSTPARRVPAVHRLPKRISQSPRNGTSKPFSVLAAIHAPLKSSDHD